jgi:PDZ domain-containing secreted protein
MNIRTGSTAKSRKTYVTKKGYSKFKDSGTYVHRWAEEKKLGRKLKPGEVVHHIDGNPLNNSPNNLKVYKNQSQHMKKEH